MSILKVQSEEEQKNLNNMINNNKLIICIIFYSSNIFHFQWVTLNKNTIRQIK